MQLLGCGENAEDAPAYYERAVILMAQEQPELALVELKGALKLDPDLQPALELKLELHEQQKDYAAVIETVDRLLELDPNHLPALLRRAELLLLSGETTRSKEPIERLLEIAPDNPKALNLKAAWLIRSGQLPQALDYSDQARAIGSPDADTFALGAMIRIRLQRLDDAHALITGGLKEHPEDAALHLLRINLAQTQSRFGELPGHYDELIDLFPAEIAYPRALALFYLRKDQQTEAIAVMQAMVDRNPDNVDARFLLGQLYARDSSGEAFSNIEALLAEHPETPQLRFLLARLYEDSDRFNSAISQYQTIAELDADHPEALTARAELARIALGQGRREDADQLISTILDINSTHTAGRLLRANTLLLDQEHQAAKDILQALLRDEPKNDKALESLGRTYLQTGLISLATDSFRSALETNPLNTLAAKQLATLYSRARDLDSVIEILTPFEIAQRGDLDIERALLQARLTQKDWPGARRLAAEGQIGQSNPILTELVEALIMQGEQQFTASIAKLRSILKSTSGNVRPVLRALLVGYQGAGKVTEGVQFFEQYQKQYADKSWSNQMLLDMYLHAGREDAATSLLESQIASEEKSPRDFILLAKLQIQAQKPQAALAVLDSGISEFPDALGIRLNKASMLEQQGDKVRAITAYEKILELNPKSDLAANNLAVLYSLEPATLAHARELANRFENTQQPYFADTLGWICAITDDLDCALPLLERSVEQLPDQAEFNYHFGAALTRANQRERAKIHLKKAARLIEAGAEIPNPEALYKLLEDLNG